MPQLTGDIHFTEGYADPAPYPPLSPLTPNSFYASLLMEDYAGSVSECTASNQYIYHHAVSKAYPDAAEALEKIAVVEMMHMEKLAAAITALGYEPVLKNAPDGNPWCAVNIQYGVSLQQRLLLDLASEYGAIENYRRHILQIKEPSLQELLLRIIKDEELHVGVFKALIEKYGC